MIAVDLFLLSFFEVVVAIHQQNTNGSKNYPTDIHILEHPWYFLCKLIGEKLLSSWFVNILTFIRTSHSSFGDESEEESAQAKTHTDETGHKTFLVGEVLPANHGGRETDESISKWKHTTIKYYEMVEVINSRGHHNGEDADN